MAVARMLRVTALGHHRVLEDVVGRFQHAGVLEVTADEDLPHASSLADEPAQRSLEERIAYIDFVREFLSRFRESEAPFSTFVSEKIHLDEEEFLGLEYDDAFRVLYEECESLSGRLAVIGRERNRLVQLLHDLEPWHEIRLPIRSWKGTDRVSLFTGTLGAARAPGVRQQLRETVTELSIEELGAVGTRQAWVIMVYTDHEEEVRSLLSLTDFEEVSFPDLSGYPAEEIAAAEETLADLACEETRLLERAEALAERYLQAVALGEALRSHHDALTVREDFGTTERTFVVRGWVPASRFEELEEALAGVEDVDIALAEPAPEEDPPALLENPRWLRPFEVVTDLYGRPRYGELDPTPMLAFFFFFFFGICLGDVGYGFGLIVIAWLIKHKLDVAEGVQRFMDLLMYGGIASAIVGVFTGSYFALDMEILPGFLRSLVVLDPLKDVSTMLLFSIAFGVLHVMWGVTLRTWGLFRKGETVEALADPASTLLLWPSVVVLTAGLLRDVTPLTWAGLVGLGLVVLLKGRVVFPPFGPKSLLGLVTGLYGVYDTGIGNISDFLSYTRLAALGMASVLVGQVMNIVAGLMLDSVRITLLGILLAALVFVVGHAFNLAISLLGAFVHPLRLQFVEFFSKFYEGGGRNYAPFGYGTESLILSRRTVRKERG